MAGILYEIFWKKNAFHFNISLKFMTGVPLTIRQKWFKPLFGVQQAVFTNSFYFPCHGRLHMLHDYLTDWSLYTALAGPQQLCVLFDHGKAFILTWPNPNITKPHLSVSTVPAGNSSQLVLHMVYPAIRLYEHQHSDSEQTFSKSFCWQKIFYLDNILLEFVSKVPVKK